ncbi:hypothetical protein C8R45DRAFT_368642 [Mycena sanguinolenta]|nr:hypothetical protein C8R45DRAFT_368642 [Mycena sanguinolenta]
MITWGVPFIRCPFLISACVIHSVTYTWTVDSHIREVWGQTQPTEPTDSLQFTPAFLWNEQLSLAQRIPLSGRKPPSHSFTYSHVPLI